MRTTLGQMIVNAGLPEDLRDYSRALDGDGTKKLLSAVQEKYPEKYASILLHLMRVDSNVAHVSGQSFSLSDLAETKARQKYLVPLRQKIEEIQSSDLPEKVKDLKTMDLMVKTIEPFKKEMQHEAAERGNNFAFQVQSGGKGGWNALAKLIGSDVAVSDFRGRPILIPIINNYATGLDPAEYWAASYGVRSGYANTRLMTAKAGFLAKQLSNAAHRLTVTDKAPAKSKYPLGLPVNVDDSDNEGSVLAMDAGGYKAGTILTPKIVKDLTRKVEGGRILIHSPLSSFTATDGIDALSAGIRTRGSLPLVGDNVGLEAAQAITERLNQISIGSKHSAGVVSGKKNPVQLSGFKYFDRLVQGPKHFPETAPLSSADGRVTKIDEAPHGGYYVYVNDKQHYVPTQHDVTVKVGDKVEAGDLLSTGIPHPRELVQYKGLGEARRTMMELMYNAARESGWKPHRRNVEVLARAIINNVKITSPMGLGEHLPDDVAPYNRIAATYTPRKGTKTVRANQGTGLYLEQPVLHYTIGTRVTPKVVDSLREFGIKEVDVHPDPPEFEPVFVRAMDQLGVDPDFMVRLGGFNLGRHFMKSVHSGGKSEPTSTSWMPGLAKGVTFGEDLKTEGKY